MDGYKEYFEIPFLDANERYYKFESKAFLAEHSISDYLKKAEERLGEEEDRVGRYLNPTRGSRLSANVVLVREHSKLMLESSQNLFDDKDQDLRRMYVLIARIPDGLEPLITKFGEHVKKSGLAAVSRLVGEGGATGEVDPRARIDALLGVRHKRSETVKRYFKGEASFFRCSRWGLQRLFQ